MRAVFVNHCHPDMAHVCAVRLRAFAEVLAAEGHRIVLLTETLARDDPAPAPAEVAAALAAHDWSRPFRLACRPQPAPLTEALQDHRLPPVLSKPTALWCYLAKGGLFWTWAAASRPYWPVIAENFRPEIVWATFGNTDALNIARGIARGAGCPWVIDIKDAWSAFVPAPLRALLAARYRGAARLTALSHGHLDDARRWFAQPGTVIYSGVPAAELAAQADPPPADDGVFRLVLTGSAYESADFAEVLARFAAWLDRPGAPARAAFAYAGHDHARVAAAAAPLAARCRVEIAPFLPRPQVLALQRGASVNLYIKGRRTPFHHKLFELIAAGRPIVCFPPDSAEAMALARDAGAVFHNCADGPALEAAFAAARGHRARHRTAAQRRALMRLGREHQARALAAVLEEAAAETGRNTAG